MPTVEDQKAVALVELQRLAQPDDTPALSEDDLDAILDDCQRASFWAQSTAFDFGAVVMPTVRNGHRYTCAKPGTTGPTEPIWPTRSAGRITDSAVEWIEAGADYENVFDVRAAAHQAWIVKEAKVAQLFDVGSEKTSQIAERCREMAESFDPIQIA